MDLSLKEINKKRIFRKIKPQRFYIHGEVGRGKTFLMDMFFQEAKTKKKTRLHFHRFMKSLHGQLKEKGGQINPVQKIVRDLVKKFDLLCFDEFYVEDIADAMLLSKFMKELFKSNISFIATSNIAPSGLYEGGLQRKLFLPAIDALEEFCEIILLNSQTDFRFRALEKSGSYFCPAEDFFEDLKKLYLELSKNKDLESSSISILNREIDVISKDNGVLWVSFDQICSSPRSSSDYVEISKEFHTLILSDVPVLSADDETRRFIALIDECYDRKVKLIISAKELPEALYVKTMLKDKFQRTISRLVEMQSKEYIALAHLP